jgi:hypothetical protein
MPEYTITYEQLIEIEAISHELEQARHTIANLQTDLGELIVRIVGDFSSESAADAFYNQFTEDAEKITA